MEKYTFPIVKNGFWSSGYGEAGASLFKRGVKGFTSRSFGTREDIDGNNPLLRERSRMLFMSSPVATSAIKTLRTNVVGQGLTLKSRINREVLGMSNEEADAFERRVEEEFSLWAENKRYCDATGMNDFYEMTQLVLMSTCLSGDCVIIPKYENPEEHSSPYDLRLHILEADRVCTPNQNAYFRHGYYQALSKNEETGNLIYDGVEVDKSGKAVAYHIVERAQLMGEEDHWERVTAYGEFTGLPNIIHVMESERPEQYRGVPLLAAVIEPLLQLRRFTEAELTAALIQSMFTVFIKTGGNPADMPIGETSEDTISTDPDEYEIGAGTINVLKPGESIEMAESKRPISTFDQFVRSISEQVGAAIEVPADLLLKSFNSSYSASRAALMEAWKSFRMRRKWLVNDYCMPVYELWMAEAVSSGYIEAPGFFTDLRKRKAYLGAEWVGPAPGQLDPVKEVTAHILARQHGYETTEQGTIEMNGSNFDSNIQQILHENQRMAESGLISDEKILSIVLENIYKEEKEDEQNEPKNIPDDG